MKADRFRTLAVVSQNGRPRPRHLSVWTEPMVDAARRTDPDGGNGGDVDPDDVDGGVSTITQELLGSLAVVRGVARLLLQDPNLAASERSNLLTVLDRQVDLMQHALSGLALEHGGLASARYLAIDDVAST